MKCLMVHNEYGRFSGEEAAFHSINSLLEEHGHEVIRFTRSSAEIPRMRFGRARVFFSGIYSLSSRKQIRRIIAQDCPDVVQVQNLFPLISPSVLPEFRRAGLPVVMRVPNYRLVCPSGLHLSDGRLCDKCRGGREYWCVLKNCEGGLSKSVGYALRNYVARRLRFFHDNVTLYYALTEFQRKRFIEDGFPPDRIEVIPNMASSMGAPEQRVRGDYVGFAGRVSPEKGVETLVAAARLLPDVQFKAAGSFHCMPGLPARAPANFQFLGHLEGNRLRCFYMQARMVVLPSTCFEGFPNACLDAMAEGKPVICSRIGGLAEVVEDGVTGLLFQPGNANELAEKTRYLWERPELCRTLGWSGREKCLREYSPETYYGRLMSVYRRAIEVGPGGPLLEARATATRVSSHALLSSSDGTGPGDS